MAVVVERQVGTRAEPSRPWFDRWAVPIVLAAAVVLYARTLGFGFHLDDYVLARPWTWDELRGTFSGPFETVGLNADPYFRPFASLSFALEWPLFGTSKVGYHVTNLVLHMAVGVGVLGLLRRVRVPRWAALVGALFFVAVPLNAWTLLYVSERTDAMVGICVVGALLLVHRYDRTHRTACLVGINVLLVLGLLSKEQATCIVPMVIVYWWYLQLDRRDPQPGGGLGSYWWREVKLAASTLVARPMRREWLRIVGPQLAVLVGYLAYRTVVLSTDAWTDRFADTRTPPVALVGGIHSTFRMTPWEFRSLTYYPAILAVVGALLLAPRARAWRVVLLGVGLVTAGVLPLTFSGAVQPRLLYVAEIGMAVCVAGLVTIYAQAIAAARRPTRTVLAAGAGALGAVLIATMLIGTVRTQNLFREGTDMKLDGQQEVYEVDLSYRAVPEEHLRDIEQRLLEAGRPLRPASIVRQPPD